MRLLRALVSTPERRILLICFAARILPAAWFYGTEDVTTWATWGELLATGGNPYKSPLISVWPPGWMPFTALAYVLSEMLHLPFSLVVKVFPIVADLIIAMLLYSAAPAFGLRAERTALAWALNPVSIYTTAIHGQIDALPTLCLTAAVLELSGDGVEARARRAGIWLGIGAALKTWPILMLPALISALRPLRKQIVLAVTAISIYFVALIIPWPFIGSTAVTYVLSYQSIAGWWGLSGIAEVTRGAGSSEVWTWIFRGSMAAVAIGIWLVRRNATTATMLLLLTFYVTTPGFGLQYLVWIVPVALLADPRRAIVYSAIATAVIAFEVLFRPYHGFIGETVVLLPHAGYAKAYGGATDQLYTVCARTVVWAFFCYWWIATMRRPSIPSPIASSASNSLRASSSSSA